MNNAADTKFNTAKLFYIGRDWAPGYSNGKASPKMVNPGRYDVHQHGLFTNQADAQAKCDELNA